MTRIIDRYVYREVLPPLFIGVGVFTFFFLIDRVYQLTNLVITKNVPFGLVMSLLVFLLPTFLSMTLPLALLVAVLLVCGRLAGDLEVAAFKAAGISPLRLFRPFLVVSCLVTCGVAWLTTSVAPTSIAGFQLQLFRILQTRAVAAVRERTFTGALGQFVVYVDEVTPSQVGLRGVLVSDERDPRLSRIILAREGRLLGDEANRRLTIRFLDGSITETEAGDQRPFRHTAFTLYDMTVPLEMPATGSSKDVKPERQLPLGGLLRAVSEVAAKGQPVAPYQVELHKRFALPVAAFVFVLVAFPLGIRTQRGGRSVALASSFIIVVAYYVLFTSLEGLAHSGRMPAALAIWLPNLLFGLVGVVFLRQALGTASTGWFERARGAGLVVAAGDWLRGRRAARAGRGRRVHGPRASTFLIDRYLVREYVTFLGLGLLGAAVLYVMVDLLQTLDRYLRVKPPLILILQHFLYDGPGEIYKGLPIIVLLATLFLFLTLSKNRELDALKAAGVSLYRTSAPILATALAVSVGAVVFQEAVLPDLTARAEEVDRVKIRGQTPRHLQRQSQIWYRSSDTRFIRMGLLDPVDRSIDNLVVLDVDPSYRIETRLDARKARWTPDGWQLADGIMRRFEAGRVRTEPFRARAGEIEEHLDDFTQVQKPPETMSFVELRSYVARLQESGRQVGKYLVQLYAKLSFPLVNLIMALVAIPFALVAPRSGGRAVAIGMAVVVGVGYWVIHSMALAFAQADLLPPMLAAWTANIVFTGIGTALFLNART